MRRLPVFDRDEQGFTLIEVIITISLLSIAFIGILSAVGAMITAGAENANAASSLTVARNLAAYMDTQAYIQCAALGAPVTGYQAEINNLATGFVSPGYAATVAGVQAWNGDNPLTFVPAPLDGRCPPSPDHGVELLTLTVTPTGTQLGPASTRTFTILKRAS